MKKTISGNAKFYPSNKMPKGKELKAYLVGWYNGGQYPEITNLKLKAVDKFPSVPTKNGSVEINEGEVFILNAHGKLKYFSENCKQQGIDPVGSLLFITYTGDIKNKRNQTVAQFDIAFDDEQKTEVLSEFPSDDEMEY